MLDLQAGVHLQEIEVALGIDDELDRAGGLVLHRLGERDRLLAHRLARLLVQERARRLFDHLLVAALDRAFALAEIEAVAVAVRQHLDLDVARVLDELLDEHAVVGEAGARLVGGGAEALARLLVAARDAHALAAAAGRGLDHDRIADFLGDLHRLVGILDHAEIAGDGIDARFLGQLLGFDLVAHRGDGVRIGPDEGDARLLQRRRELAVLGQEAIAGMDRLGAGLLAGLDDLLDREIALRRRRRADRHRLVRLAHMQRIGVRLGIDRHGLDAHGLRRPDDPAGDLPAIGDEDLREHANAAMLVVLAEPRVRPCGN